MGFRQGCSDSKCFPAGVDNRHVDESLSIGHQDSRLGLSTKEHVIEFIIRYNVILCSIPSYTIPTVGRRARCLFGPS